MSAPIGIIGAMQVEIDLLLERMTDQHAFTAADVTVYEGTLGDTPVVIARCGIGKVSAALSTQVLIDHAHPRCVINTGVAGALDASLAIGDLVISTDAVQHDFDVAGLGYAPGVIPELGIGQAGVLSFAADESLVDVIIEATHEVAPDITAIKGRIASGDQFVCTQELRDKIISTFGASCCEMEGAAIAHACWRNDVPFVIVRAISDNADETSKEEYRLNEQQIAEHCANIVANAVERLS